MKKNPTEKELKERIKALEVENRRLKNEIKKLRSNKQGYYTLKNQFDSSVDLGEFTHSLPPFIPEHKKWSANDYPTHRMLKNECSSLVALQELAYWSSGSCNFLMLKKDFDLQKSMDESNC